LTTTEAYRLRRLVAGTLQPTEGEERLFVDWQDALRAARELGGAACDVVTQAVLVDESGAVVFPPDNVSPRTSARWSVAPVIHYGPRAKARRGARGR